VAAVSVATMCFGIIAIGVVVWEQGLRGLGAIPIVAFAAIVFWFVTFVTAGLPVALTYLVARLLRIRSIYYYLVCGAVTGVALAPIYVTWSDWHEDDSMSFLQSYLQVVPIFVAIGAGAAATFWSTAGRYVCSKSTRSMRNYRSRPAVNLDAD
jgi:hypothetical protein